MDQRLSVVTLGVADLSRARRFYETGLGWKAARGSSEHVVFFQAGGMVVALFPLTELAKDASIANDGHGFGGITLAQNLRTKEDVDAALAQAKAAGARILKPAQDTFWGGYSGYFAEPDGHPGDVAWNPHWNLDAGGNVKIPG